MKRAHNIDRLLRLEREKGIRIRRVSRNHRTKKQKNRIKYRIDFPNSVKDVLLLDVVNTNNLWAESITKEMAALESAGVWKYHPPKYKVGKRYQFAPLILIFDVKQEDLRRKARLVAG